MASNPEQLIMDAAARAVKFAPDGDPDGYAACYMLVMNKPLPKHGYRWIEEMYKAHADRMGLIAEAFRGSYKTTILTNNFSLYRIGLEPEKRSCGPPTTNPAKALHGWRPLSRTTLVGS
jgi:hypothetical protein